MTETIFALSSGRGPAGVAVVRVSGRRAGEAVLQLTGKALPAPRVAVLRELLDSETGETIDQSLLLWFPSPASFTGEDVAEFHVHGGPAVVSGVLTALGHLDGLRPAEPGEFTRRAFLAGKMDLTQVEGLADLIHAETEAQRRQALRQMQGVLTNLYEGWRSRLIRALAYVEADIDFADEDDVPEHVSAQVRGQIESLSEEIARHLADGSRGERLRDGLSVAIIGKPNAGKSSLLNALAKRDVAIVSNIAGTTRDIIEVHLNLGGYPVTLIDTAGLRETDDPVEAEGVARARARAEAADLRLHLTPYGEEPATADESTLAVVTKVDLEDGADAGARDGRFYISILTGAGLGELIAHLADWAGKALSGGESVLLTRERHRHALETCRACLQNAIVQPDLVLMAEDMRLAARALGRITGRVDVEDLLDVIFRDFCIGK